MQRKRLLMVSYYFAPQNTIGAVRPTKLAKYLTRMGYDVTVICGAGMNAAKDPTLAHDLEGLSDVHMIREWNPLRDYKARKRSKAVRCAEPSAGKTGGAAGAAKARTATGKAGYLHRMLDSLYLYLWWLSDRSFRRRAIRELGRLPGGYDAVFSSYAPLSVHEIAREAKRRGLAGRWIADFRDEVNMSFGWQEGYRKRYMRMIRQEADVLCAVSGGFLEMMDLSGVGRILSNGFDREDLTGIHSMGGGPERRFRAVYCGQLREGRKHVQNRDITPFFSALRGLIDEGVCAESELSLVYAGDEGDVFLAAAEAYGLERCVENHGRVTRERSLALQLDADALLMASWNMAGQTGILTGKLFEYMMMDKPIICCMAGDLAGSELGRVLKRTGMGFCHEQANAETDAPALTEYLRALILSWRQEQPLLLSKNETEVEKYAYPALAAEIDAWMEKME